MSDQTMTSTETLPVDPPAVTPTPAPAAVAPVSAQGKPQGKKNGGGKQIRIPQNAFKARIDREAAAIVRRRLGISLEDAEKLVKQGGGKVEAATPAAVPAAVAATVSNTESAHSAELARLRKQLEQTKKIAFDWQNKHRKDTTRLKDKQIEAELSAAAARAGVVDTDYAVHLFAKAAASGKATDPGEFFTALKGTHVHLFSAPKPVEVTPTTAPPESMQPGEAKPVPVAAGTPAKATNAEDMNPLEFNRHLRSYGFSPGM